VTNNSFEGLKNHSDSPYGPGFLKELCHEIIIFWKVLKVKSVLSVNAPKVFNLFCILIVKKNTFKVSACFYGNLNSAFEKANSKSSASDFDKFDFFTIISGLRNIDLPINQTQICYMSKNSR
jgi:hypothetical protein